MNIKFIILCLIVLIMPFVGSYQVKMMTILPLSFLFIDGMYKKKLLRFAASEKFLLLFSFFSLLSISWSILSDEYIISYGFNCIGISIIFFTVYNLCNTERKWYFLGYFYIVGCVIISLIIIYYWMKGISFSDNDRFSIEGINSNYIAYTLAMSLPIMASIRWNRNNLSIKDNIYFAAVALLLCFSIILTGCRGAFIGYLFGLIVVNAKTYSRNKIRGIFLLLIILCTFLYLYFYIISSSRIFSLDISGEANIYSNRDWLWGEALRLIYENMYFGIGLGSFLEITPNGLNVHNVFLSIAVDFGLIGLFLYLASIVPIFKNLFSSKILSWGKSAAIILFVVWFPIAFTGVWEFSAPAWFCFAWFYSIPNVANINKLN